MRPLLVLILLFTTYLKAQISRDTSFRSSNTEYPLAFINHGNFTGLLTNSVQLSGWYKNAGNIVIRGMNPDHSVKFSKSLNLYGMQPIAFDKIQSIYQTNNKGLFFLLGGSGCSNSTYQTYSFNWIVRTDSSGNIIFQRFDIPNTFKHIGFVSSSFYFVGSINTLQKINNLTGFQTNTIHITNGIIKSTAVNHKKQITVCTNDSLMIIDTLGALITSVPGNFSFEKIYPYKKNFVLLHSSRTQLEYRDSNLTFISSLTLPVNKKALDVYTSKDSIYIAMQDLQSKISSISVYDLNFNLLDQKNITNPNQTIVQLAKEERLQLLINEQAGSAWNNAIIAQGGDVAICNSSYSTFNNLQSVNYPFDIEVKRIKNIQIITSLNSQILTNPAYNYTYTNHLILYNNSIDTIRSFCISHPYKMIQYGSSQYCNSNMSYYTYQNTFNIKIAPNDSIELVLPDMVGTKFSDSLSFPIEFRYSASLPNGKTEKNMTNSHLTFSTYINMNGINEIDASTGNDDVFPNPTSNFINLPFNITTTNASSAILNKNIVIKNILGQTLLVTEDRENINISALSSGVYIISFEYNGKMIEKKFVKMD